MMRGHALRKEWVQHRFSAPNNRAHSLHHSPTETFRTLSGTVRSAIITKPYTVPSHAFEESFFCLQPQRHLPE